MHRSPRIVVVNIIKVRNQASTQWQEKGQRHVSYYDVDIMFQGMKRVVGFDPYNFFLASRRIIVFRTQ
ncbi:hypothetical protein ACET3Z_009116 [Daucus carota]